MYSEVMDNTPVRMSDPDFVWLGLFKLFDLDQNREIDAGEAERLLDEQDESLFTQPVSINQNLLDSEFEASCRNYFYSVDTNKDGEINFQQFKGLMIEMYPEVNFSYALEEHWIKVLLTFDDNENEKISWQEAWSMLKSQNWLNLTN